jgi:PKD repeat protein
MRSLSALVLAPATVGCEGSPARPSTSTPPPTTDAPVARIDVAVDELGSRDAIVGLSQVSVDTRASAGSGPLTVAIDFGDGTTATDALARHVYDRAGTFTITVNVRDSAGRTATAIRQIVVKMLTGRWFHAGYVQRAHQFELRYLTIANQDGSVVRGTFRGQDQIERPFTGRLTSPRGVQIVLDDQTVQLDGVAPGRLYEDGQLWTFQVRGGSVDGERLAFRPVVGDPTGPPPDAVLKIRIDSFGSGYAIEGLSPTQFDGSTSRGDGLSHVIEYGDGDFSTDATAVHILRGQLLMFGSFPARLTVVDRFGRADKEVAQTWTRSLVDSSCCSSMWVKEYPQPPGGCWSFRFENRQALNLTGFCGTEFTSYPPVTATLSGERDIHIVVPVLSIEFRGHFELDAGWSNLHRMILTQIGGPDHGRTWFYHWDDGPG